VVKIRLMRMGAKKRPFYRVVVANAHAPADGRVLEVLGYYNPLTDPPEVKVDLDRAKAWMKKGAQPTGQARAVLKLAEIQTVGN